VKHSDHSAVVWIKQRVDNLHGRLFFLSELLECFSPDLDQTTCFFVVVKKEILQPANQSTAIHLK